MFPFRRVPVLGALAAFCALLSSCGSGYAANGVANPLSYSQLMSSGLGASPLSGNVTPVRDPSIIHADGKYYVFITDAIGAWKGSLPILCSEDRTSWTQCGSIFDRVPEWLQWKLPKMNEIWAPDVSYFHGEYHVYYSASIANTQRTVVGLATNVTLDPADPRYHWVDRGPVMESFAGDEINDLDPNILKTRDGRIWISYGSYWGGIRQREIDPNTGLLKNPRAAAYPLAARPYVAKHPIEGSSQLQHGDSFYLFVSIDFCCNRDLATNNYKMAVGRSKSPNGPFLDRDGTPMMEGGATVVLKGDEQWVGVGGGTVYDDPDTGETLIVFHGQQISEGGRATLWIKKVRWNDGWPEVE